jgi:hypothetical protein
MLLVMLVVMLVVLVVMLPVVVMLPMAVITIITIINRGVVVIIAVTIGRAIVGPAEVNLEAGIGARGGKAYPVDSGHATCCVLNDRILPVVGTNINGQGAFAFPIPEGVF